MEFDGRGEFSNLDTRRYLAATAMELIDDLPSPRHMELDERVEAAIACLSGFGVKELVTAFNAPDTSGPVNLVDATIRGLREAGERVGPFRSRKIRKISELT